MAQKPFNDTMSLSDWLVADHAALHSLDSIEALIDWFAIERRLSVIYNSPDGRASAPLLTLFRALLLGHLHKIDSDGVLAKLLARDLLFRKFCRIDLSTTPPSHDSLSRFRRELAAHGLWEELLEEINDQLKAQHIIIEEGQVSIIDATVVEAHQIQGDTKDAEADWSVKTGSRGKTEATYGYKIHSNCDEDGFIMKQTVTAGNEYDGNQRDALMTGDEVQLYADSAYDSAEKREDLARRGVENRVQRKGCRHKKLTKEDREWNAEVGVMRSVIEHQFAEYKERYSRLRRTRFMGLAMNEVHAGMAAIAHNLKKGARFLEKYGLPQEQCV